MTFDLEWLLGDSIPVWLAIQDFYSVVTALPGSACQLFVKDFPMKLPLQPKIKATTYPKGQPSQSVKHLNMSCTI